MIALAAPASATPQSQPTKAGDNNVVHTFLYGNCDGKPACPKEVNKPTEVSHPGILNQFDFFRQDLKSQPTTFGESIGKFVKGITGPSTTPE